MSRLRVWSGEEILRAKETEGTRDIYTSPSSSPREPGLTLQSTWWAIRHTRGRSVMEHGCAYINIWPIGPRTLDRSTPGAASTADKMKRAKENERAGFLLAAGGVGLAQPRGWIGGRWGRGCYDGKMDNSGRACEPCRSGLPKLCFIGRLPFPVFCTLCHVLSSMRSELRRTPHFVLRCTSIGGAVVWIVHGLDGRRGK